MTGSAKRKNAYKKGVVLRKNKVDANYMRTIGANMATHLLSTDFQQREDAQDTIKP